MHFIPAFCKKTLEFCQNFVKILCLILFKNKITTAYFGTNFELEDISVS